MISKPIEAAPVFGTAELLMFVAIVGLWFLVGEPDLLPTEHEWGTGSMSPSQAPARRPEWWECPPPSW